MRKLPWIATAGTIVALTVVVGFGVLGGKGARAQPLLVDLSVDSVVTSAPTDLDVSQNGTLSVSTTGTNTGAPTSATVEVTVSHTVTAPAGCTVGGGATANDSWTGDLDSGASHVLQTDFTIHCSEPSDHQFVVDNEITLDEPGYIDPDLGNNTDQELVDVEVWADSDIKISSFDVVYDRVIDSDGDTVPDVYAVDVSTPTDIIVRKVLHNNGPYGPTEVELTKTASVVMGDAEVLPLMDSEQAVLDVSSTVTVDETFTIHCYDSNVNEVAVFEFHNNVVIKDVHIEDADPPSADAYLTVYCVPRFTPTFSITIDEDDATQSPPVGSICLMGLPCKSLTSVAIPSATPKQPMAQIQTIYPAAFAYGGPGTGWQPSTAITNAVKVGKFDLSVVFHIQGLTPGCTAPVAATAELADAAMPGENPPPDATGAALFPDWWGGLAYTKWATQLDAVDAFVQANYPGAVLWAHYNGVDATLSMPVNVLIWNLDPNGFLAIGLTSFDANPDLDLDGLWNFVDPDDDGDTVLDLIDNCVRTANPAQEDADVDDVGDACDPNPYDALPVDPESYDCTPYSAETLILGETMDNPSTPDPEPIEFLRTCEDAGTHTVLAMLIREDTGEATGLDDSITCVTEFGDVDLSVDSGVPSPPTDLDASVNDTLHVDTTGTHTGGPLPDTVEVTVSHTVTAPAGCTVNGGATASDSWTGVLAGGASHVLSTNFTIHCSEPSDHQFVVDNEITLDEPGYEDPDLGNNTDQEIVDVEVWADSDIKITSFDVVYDRLVDSDGDTVPDIGVVDVSTPTDVIVRKELHNNGPYGPTEVTLTKTASVVQGDAEVLPLMDSEQTVLDVSSTVVVDETFTIHCHDSNVGEMAAFEFHNDVAIKAPHVEDADPPSADAVLLVLCVPRFTPTFSVTIDADDGTMAPPVSGICTLGIPCKSLTSVAIPSGTPMQPLAVIQTVYPAALDIANGTTITSGYTVGKSDLSVVAHVQGLTTGCTVPVADTAYLYDACLDPITEPACALDTTGAALFPGPPGGLAFTHWAQQLDAVENFVQTYYPGAVVWARYVGNYTLLSMPINILVWDLGAQGWWSIDASANPDNDLDGLWDPVVDIDDDGDTVPDVIDNCLLTPNSTQEDWDGDGVGNLCDPNTDVPGCEPTCACPDPNDFLSCLDPRDPETYFCSPYLSNTLSLGETQASSGEVLRTCDESGTHTVTAILVREDTGEPTAVEDTITCAAVDTDGDTVPDDSDNCPDDYNPAQTNTDADLEAAGASVVGDSLGDECDDDDDNEGYDDDVETYLGTETLDNCPGSPPGPGGDAWPLDIDMNGVLNLTGDASLYPGEIGCNVSTKPECKRLDLDANGVINLTGDASQYVGRIGESCT